jgi:SagB-type dehydrogenase family enzyme
VCEAKARDGASHRIGLLKLLHPSMTPWEFVAAYHHQTKHHYDRFARSLGYLDWAAQPDPFRRFDGTTLWPLGFSRNDASPSYDDLFTPGAVPSQPVTLGAISEFFEFSLALSAWKQYLGSRWALRINPSSGNLHPTEGYLVIGPMTGLGDSPGVYHYAPREHALERRAEFPLPVWHSLIEGFPRGTFLAALTSIHWREAWKYGERAYRYCQHDAGHALAALTVSAAVQGWEARLLQAWGDADIARLLGLDRAADFADAEHEHPDLLLAVIPAPSGAGFQPVSPPKMIADSAGFSWSGHANCLSRDHVEWQLIDAVADACTKPTTEPPTIMKIESWGPPLPPNRPPASARKIIRQRRSAVAFDGVTSITAEQFCLMLDRVLPRSDRIPWNALGPPVCVHLGLFVHRVIGLSPGLYFLVRDPGKVAELRAATDPKFGWTRPDGCPESLPLYLLAQGDVRQIAGQLSCGQDIAAESAFSLGMIAEFEEPLKTSGAWFYRRLFWETGVIGQTLYLEAEAAGVRATGIGCFFDDPVHAMFGLQGTNYQSLYHFTVGGPIEDARLTTLPPYAMEMRAASR